MLFNQGKETCVFLSIDNRAKIISNFSFDIHSQMLKNLWRPRATQTFTSDHKAERN